MGYHGYEVGGTYWVEVGSDILSGMTVICLAGGVGHVGWQMGQVACGGTRRVGSGGPAV